MTRLGRNDRPSVKLGALASGATIWSRTVRIPVRRSRATGLSARARGGAKRRRQAVAPALPRQRPPCERIVAIPREVMFGTALGSPRRELETRRPSKVLGGESSQTADAFLEEEIQSWILAERESLQDQGREDPQDSSGLNGPNAEDGTRNKAMHRVPGSRTEENVCTATGS